MSCELCTENSLVMHAFEWTVSFQMGLSFPDPHIKVSGDPDDVKLAKDRIMSVLDTKVSGKGTCPQFVKSRIQ